MTETVEPKEKRKQERSLALVLMLTLGSGLSMILKEWILSSGMAFLVSWMIALVVAYWVPPRPAERFLRYLLESSIVLGAIYLIVFLIPAWLEGQLPLLHYGIPIVAFILFLIVVRRSSFFSAWRT